MNKIEEILRKMHSGQVKAKRESHRRKIIKNKNHCEICKYEPSNKDELWRFRINKDIPFSNDNVIILCTTCHSKLRARLNHGEPYNQAVTEMVLENVN